MTASTTQPPTPHEPRRTMTAVPPTTAESICLWGGHGEQPGQGRWGEEATEGQQKDREQWARGEGAATAMREWQDRENKSGVNDASHTTTPLPHKMWWRFLFF